MGIKDVANMGKTMYKARQAQKQMSKVKAAGKESFISLMMNGVNEVTDVEIDVIELAEFLGMDPEDSLVKKLAKKLEESIKKSSNSAKKNLEKELMNSTDIEELKSMFGM